MGLSRPLPSEHLYTLEGSVDRRRRPVTVSGRFDDADARRGQEDQGLGNLLRTNAPVATAQLAPERCDVQPSALLERILGLGDQDVQPRAFEPGSAALSVPGLTQRFDALVSAERRTEARLPCAAGPACATTSMSPTATLREARSSRRPSAGPAAGPGRARC